jgi:hypothetical protein
MRVERLLLPEDLQQQHQRSAEQRRMGLVDHLGDDREQGDDEDAGGEPVVTTAARGVLGYRSQIVRRQRGCKNREQCVLQVP